MIETSSSQPRAPAASDPIAIAAFYRFAPLGDCEALAASLRRLGAARGLRGTVLLGAEGINATLAGTRPALEEALALLQREPGLAALRVNWSTAEAWPFHRFKVRLKREIVTLGVAGIAPAATTGIHVEPADWNALIEDPDVTVVDTRNTYEYAIGRFDRARSPHTDNFRAFPTFAQAELDPARPVAMYCTGGIRCEKASSYLLERGFERVYQLAGGVLGYLAHTPPEASRWSGECFVFDARVAVDAGLAPGTYQQCFGCRWPLSAAERASPHYEPGVSCPHCHDTLDARRRAAFVERRRQEAIARSRHRRHVGAVMPRSSAN